MGGREILMNPKLKLGIIGPGLVTEHVMQNCKSIADDIESITFYNHRESIQRKFNGHKRTFKSNCGNSAFLNIDWAKEDNFDRFMELSDVIIINLGINTPEIFLDGKQALSTDFNDLEGHLRREAQKAYQDFGKTKFASEEEFKSFFFSTYYTLKVVQTVSQESFELDGEKRHYFEDAFRLFTRFPSNSPFVLEYGHKFQDYFNRKEKEHNPQKFLIMDSNTAEDCLNLFLGVCPSMIEHSVSLAQLDIPRAETILNEILETEYNKPRGLLVRVKLLGDHDTYTIPNFTKLEVDPQKNVDPLRVKELKEIFENKEKCRAIFERTRKGAASYYNKYGTVEDLANHAGLGIVSTLEALLKGKICSNGYFKPLGETYGLQEREGLCFIDEYKVSLDGEFQLIPEPQEVKYPATNTLLEICKRAHVALYHQLKNHPFLGVERFPQRGETKSAPQKVIDVSEIYLRERKLRTEVLVPSYIISSGEAKLTAVDLSTGGTREHVFSGRAKEDSFIRYVGILQLEGKQQVICTFRKDYVSLDPDTLKEIVQHKISSPMVRSLPERNQKSEASYRINSAAVLGEEIVLSHQLYGVVFVNMRTGAERTLDLGYISPTESLRGVTVNPIDNDIYFLVNNRVHVHSPQGKVLGVYRGEVDAPLGSLLFLEKNLFVSTDRKKVPGYGFILAGKIGDYGGGLKIVDKFKGDVMFLQGKLTPREQILEAAYDNNLISYRFQEGDLINFKTGKVHQLKGKSRFYGMTQHIHTYLTASNKDDGEQKLYELDQYQGKIELLMDFGLQKEDLLMTLAILETRW